MASNRSVNNNSSEMPIGTFEVDENSNKSSRIFTVDKESSSISTGNLEMDKVGSSISTGNLEMDKESSNILTSNVEMDKEGPSISTGNLEMDKESSRTSTGNLEMDKESTSMSTCSLEDKTNSSMLAGNLEDKNYSSMLTSNLELKKEISNELSDISDLDTMYAQELFLIVYRRRRPEKKKPFTVDPLTNSPLTPELRDICRVMMHNKEIEMFIVFAVQTSVSSLSETTFENMSHECISNFARRYFCPKAFLWMCLILFNNASLAFNRGIYIAPHLAMYHIKILLSWLRRRGEFSDDSWKTIEAIGEDIKAQLQDYKS